MEDRSEAFRLSAPERTVALRLPFQVSRTPFRPAHLLCDNEIEEDYPSGPGETRKLASKAPWESAAADRVHSDGPFPPSSFGLPAPVCYATAYRSYVDSP